MAVKFVVEFHGAQKTPFVSGAKGRSLKQLINYLVALMSGSFSPAGASMKVRNAAVAASATVTFSGAASAADTVTVNGQALTATQKNATQTVTFSTAAPAVDDTVTVNGTALTVKTGCSRATVTFASLANADTITVNGTVFTAVTSGASGAVQFNLGANDTDAATNFVAKVNAHPTVSLVIEASSAAGVNKLKALASGTAGNALTIASSNGTRAAITVASGGFFTGGAALTQDQFDKGDTVTQAARQFCACVNAHSIVKQIATGTNSAGVATLRAVTAGTAANAYTLAKSGTNIAVGGATFANGAAAANNAFDPGNSAATAGAAFTAALSASTTSKVSGPIVATHDGAGVVTLTAQPGVLGNLATLAKSGSNIAVSGAAFTGGSESAAFSFNF